MRWARVQPVPGSLYVWCCRCQKWILDARAWAEMEGESFVYYCETCKQKREQEIRHDHAE